MKANELRIGNWVLNKRYKSGYVMQIESIGEFGVNIELGYDGRSPIIEDDCSFNECNPIPLTEEWLLKFGFEKKGQLYTKDFFGDYIGVDVKDFSIGTYAFGRIAHAPQPTFMNVHQLQNLYFALTGEELTINKL
jgi:hypothetical protein